MTTFCIPIEKFIFLRLIPHQPSDIEFELSVGDSVLLKDSYILLASQEFYDFTIDDKPKIEYPKNPIAYIGVYTAIVPTFGDGYTNFTLKSGSLPEGLGLNPNTGVISGVSTTRHTGEITISCGDDESLDSSFTLYSIHCHRSSMPYSAQIISGDDGDNIQVELSNNKTGIIFKVNGMKPNSVLYYGGCITRGNYDLIVNGKSNWGEDSEVKWTIDGLEELVKYDGTEKIISHTSSIISPDSFWECSNETESDWYQKFELGMWKSSNKALTFTGPNRYYRSKFFLWDDLSNIMNLRITVTYSSGILLYINGIEIFKENLAANLTANEKRTTPNFLLSVPLAALRLGHNDIAVFIAKKDAEDAEDAEVDNFKLTMVPIMNSNKCTHKTKFAGNPDKMIFKGNDNLHDMNLDTTALFSSTSKNLTFGYNTNTVMSDTFSRYSIITSSHCPNADPQSWTFEGYYNGEYIILHSVSNANLEGSTSHYPGQGRRKQYNYELPLTFKSFINYTMNVASTKSANHGIAALPTSICNGKLMLAELFTELCKPDLCPKDSISPSAPIETTNRIPCPAGSFGYIERKCVSDAGIPIWVESDKNCLQKEFDISYQLVEGYLSFEKVQEQSYKLISEVVPEQCFISPELPEGIKMNPTTCEIFGKAEKLDKTEFNLTASFLYPNLDKHFSFNIRLLEINKFCSDEGFAIVINGEFGKKPCNDTPFGYVEAKCSCENSKCSFGKKNYSNCGILV